MERESPMKNCTKCNIEKPLTEFAIKKSRKDGRQSACKKCQREYAKEWYLENRISHKDSIRTNKQRSVSLNRANLAAYLKKHPCVDCGESRIVCLDFDHVRGTKRNDICKMVYSNSWETILQEITKCQVRCANCHRIKTAKQFNWFKSERP